MKVNVSIVTPVYNTEEYLHRCIQSIRRQKGVSFHFFIIDDGSTDNSLNIINFYKEKDSRITVIQKNNEGQGIARNKAIELIDSEYVYFVDSDDYLGNDYTISMLYKSAKENYLDICSPNVPIHYFDKPLENVSCLPTKSQFIKASILKKFDIFQPNISSGQDGVFSHLVLSHCNRIGMNSKAVYNYTHAREGSTFLTHLQKVELVPDIVSSHYKYIISHYEKYDLWEKNYLRILAFASDETLRNRIDPHFINMSFNQRFSCFKVIQGVVIKCRKYLSKEDLSLLSPIIVAFLEKPIEEVISLYEEEYLGKEFKVNYPRLSNLKKGDLLICKYANDKFNPNYSLQDIDFVFHKDLDIKNKGDRNSLQEVSSINNELVHMRDEIKALKGKLDLVLNQVNNSTIQLLASLENKNNLLNGTKDLIVSLTTIPSRLNLVHFSVESILAQTVLPEKIVLYITSNINEYDLPVNLKNLEGRGLDIKFIDDVGPHTKLIYALKDFGGKSIVTVDDDVIYPINMLQSLYEQHKKFPKAIIANWARELSFDSFGEVNGIRSGRLLTPILLENEIEQAKKFEPTPNLLGFPYGTGGVLYPAGSLHKKVFDIQAFKRLCPKEDDIWFKAMSILNKTPVVTTNLGINPQHHCLTGTQNVALRHDNHGNGENEAQMKKVFNELSLYRYLK